MKRLASACDGNFQPDHPVPELHGNRDPGERSSHEEDRGDDESEKDSEVTHARPLASCVRKPPLLRIYSGILHPFAKIPSLNPEPKPRITGEFYPPWKRRESPTAQKKRMGNSRLEDGSNRGLFCGRVGVNWRTVGSRANFEAELRTFILRCAACALLWKWH